MKTLNSLYHHHEGKVSDKWTHYLDAYNNHFKEYQSKPIRLLEIGIQNGGSLEVWSQYFEQAEALVGCDINPDCIKLQYDNDARIAVVVADANSDGAEKDIISYSPSFDIVIDDGSHRSGDIIRTFARYFKYISDDGIFVVEDLHCSYWVEFDGGCYDPYSSVAFFKKLVDMTNFEHWGVDVSRIQFLDGFAQKYDIVFTEDVLASIHSIEFSNSLCFIRKRVEQQNQLGVRVIAGQLAEIVPIILDLGGTFCPKLSQADTVWSADNKSIEDRYLMTLATIKDMEQTLSALRQLIVVQDIELSNTHKTIITQEQQIIVLSEAVEAKEQQIIVLSEAVEAKEQQIIVLSEAVEAKEQQIIVLSEAVEAKEQQIIVLSEAVEAKEQQIIVLSEAVEAKEQQIIVLSQTVADKDSRIIKLSHELTQYNDKMVQMWFALRS